MTAEEMRAALKPSADRIAESEQRLVLGDIGRICRLGGMAARKKMQRQRAVIVREWLEEDARLMGLGVGFFGWIILRWVISQIVSEIVKGWISDTE